VTLAHIGGLPVEETFASLGPALLAAFGVAWANLRARRARVRPHPRSHATSSRAGPRKTHP
jgi:hypothetical protein